MNLYESIKNNLKETDIEDDDTLIIDGVDFSEESTATRWLRDKLEEYGNTYHFDASDKRILNKLIERYGNTYHWQ